MWIFFFFFNCELVFYELQILDFLELSLTSVDAKMGRSTGITYVFLWILLCLSQK